SASERKGDRTGAKQGYHECLAKDIRSEHAAESFYGLGRIARGEGNVDLASSYFKEAAAAGGEGFSLREIADLLFQTGEYREAARQYRQLAASADTGKQELDERTIVATLRADDLPSAQPLISSYQSRYGKIKASEAEFEYERAG